MVQQDSLALDRMFHALDDPTRRAMLQSLAIGSRNIGELAAPHRMSFAAASKHVRVLEKAGLVRRRIDGRSHVCRIEPAVMQSAEQWLREHRAAWEHHLDALGEYLAEQERQEKAGK